MKNSKTLTVTARRISVCAAEQAITIAGRTFKPDEDSAYVEFFLAHAFPVVISELTGIHPQVVANSYRTMEGKIFNFAHMIIKQNPKEYKQDRSLGTIMAVEFPDLPAWCPECGVRIVECGLEQCPGCNKAITAETLVKAWRVQADPLAAPGIRAVAVMHKCLQGVDEILSLWAKGRTVMGDGEWTVSMENELELEESGFAVAGTAGIESFVERTPADLRALGYTYVPAMSAPTELLKCVNNEVDDEREDNVSTRIVRQFNGQKTILLVGGLSGSIRFSGVGLTPLGKEKPARVSKMLASEKMLDAEKMLQPLHELADKFLVKG